MIVVKASLETCFARSFHSDMTGKYSMNLQTHESKFYIYDTITASLTQLKMNRDRCYATQMEKTDDTDCNLNMNYGHVSVNYSSKPCYCHARSVSCTDKEFMEIPFITFQNLHYFEEFGNFIRLKYEHRK